MPNPRVSVLLPVLNEEAFIDACLESLARQGYPGEIEIIVAEGGSTDNTPALLQDWRVRLPLLRVVDNPQRVQSHGLNLAAKMATGEILTRADAHTTYSRDYVQRSVTALEETRATAVGGIQVAAADDGFGRSVATAMGIPLAVGPAPFRHAKARAETDTVYLGSFRRSDWERLGGWRTLPSRVAEDADLYYRWRQQGARVLVDPAIVSSYSPRDTPGRLWHQYYRYGLAKADMLYVNGRWPSWRPTAPLALVSALAVGLILGFTWSWWPLAALLVSWQGALSLATRGRLGVMLAASTMHLAYGMGLARGVLRWPPSVRRRLDHPW